MDVKVRFRFNKLTGEVEHFEVGQDSGLPYAEHEREHDRVAAEIGALLESYPRVTEILPDAHGGEAPATETASVPVEDEEPATGEPARETERPLGGIEGGQRR